MEKKIDSTYKDSSMTQVEFYQLKGITMEMKESGKSEVIATTPIFVAAPSEGVIVA